MGGFEYHIDKHIDTLSKQEAMNATYTKELNLISYKGGDPKYDIRKWKYDEDGNALMMKGITLSAGEAAALAAALINELKPQNRK